MSRFTPGASNDSYCGKKNAAEHCSGFPRTITQQCGIRCGLRRTATPGVDQAARPRCGGIDASRSVGLGERLLGVHRTTLQSMHSNRN
jgi:hypothetical protein